MNSKFLIGRLAILPVALLLFLSAPLVKAQEEAAPTVVDEVIAQVNADVVTLSMLKREMREAVETLKQRGMSDEEATAEVAKRQPELIAGLITEQLILQRGKEMGLTEEVEAEVNRRLLELAKQQNVKTLEALDEAMRQSGVDPVVFRQQARVGIMQSMVLYREVDAKVYYGLTQQEIKTYYEQHRDQFRRPETLTLSEIFLSTSGKTEDEVRARAAQIVQQARQPGADFTKLVATNSEREQTRANKGKIGAIQMSDVTRPEVAAALKNLKVGGISDPIRSEDGFTILRLDERTAAGESAFDENKIREALTNERIGKERAAYMRRLRGDSYVKIAEGYRASVEPILNRDAQGAPGGNSSSSTAQPASTPAAGSTTQQTTNTNSRRP
ncbi:MAG: peptidyl-prolyl cis-trans isomerase [Pyrinomonadaceae bacterium]|nr:peptidyl-prolyl cis-trans isomerase [Pyrinomonadaceae bacterium]